MPDISVLMSVYNGERWLKESIESVFSQLEDDFEFILINDGSTDNTENIINCFQDDRLVIISQERIGLTKSLNAGLSIARGKFIARIDADDICMPDRFYKQKQFLLNNPDVVLVGANAKLIDENSSEIGSSVSPTTFEELIYRLENFQPVFSHSSIFFRRDRICREGGYNINFERSQDSELYLRLSEKYRLAGLDEFLISLRITSDSLSYNDNGHLQLTMGLAALISYYRRKHGLTDFSTLPDSDWFRFLNKIQNWMDKKKFFQQRFAKKEFRRCRTLFMQRKYQKAISALASCLKNDYTFFLYKDINLNAPDDFSCFLIDTNIL